MLVEKKNIYIYLYMAIYFYICSFTVHGGEKVHQKARQKVQQNITQLQKR